MPEQITKHPDVTLKVLESGGARCGEGGTQKILTQCPAERFCSLPGGEMCVYGLEDIPKMAQISVDDLAAVVCPPADTTQASMLPGLGPGTIVFAIGLMLGAALKRRG